MFFGISFFLYFTNVFSSTSFLLLIFRMKRRESALWVMLGGGRLTWAFASSALTLGGSGVMLCRQEQGWARRKLAPPARPQPLPLRKRWPSRASSQSRSCLGLTKPWEGRQVSLLIHVPHTSNGDREWGGAERNQCRNEKFHQLTQTPRISPVVPDLWT